MNPAKRRAAAAARIGVSTKTINRYLRELRQRGHPGAAA